MSSKHGRRWASDSGPGHGMSSADSSPDVAAVPPSAEEEFVEVTLDFQDDDTVIIRSVEPAAAPDGGGAETPASPWSRSGSIRRSSSHRLRQFSQELKAEALARARQLSHELRRFSWSHRSSREEPPGGLEARALRRQKAQLDRTRSGAQKALRGLRFISINTPANAADSWNQILSNFEKLSKDGLLHRSDFAQCIGSLP